MYAQGLSFTPYGQPGVCGLFTWAGKDGTRIDNGKKANQRRQCNVLAMFSWKILGHGIHISATLACKTYLNIVVDQVHTFMATVFPDSSCLIQQESL